MCDYIANRIHNRVLVCFDLVMLLLLPTLWYEMWIRAWHLGCNHVPVILIYQYYYDYFICKIVIYLCLLQIMCNWELIGSNTAHIDSKLMFIHVHLVQHIICFMLSSIRNQARLFLHMVEIANYVTCDPSLNQSTISINFIHYIIIFKLFTRTQQIVIDHFIWSTFL